MSATPDGTLADPQQIIADLQHQLALRTAERDDAQRKLKERTAERDEALEQQTATAEVLESTNQWGDELQVWPLQHRLGTGSHHSATALLPVDEGRVNLILSAAV